MDDVQNMDGESKPESLGVHINDDFVDNLPTLFPFDSLHDGFEEENLMESFNYQADLPTQNIQETISILSVVPTPVEGLMLEGAVSSIEGQDMNQTSYLNQFHDVENEDMPALQGIHHYDEQNSSNPLVSDITENNNFNGINNQASPNPASFHRNPVLTWPRIETGFSSGQLVTPKRATLFPPRNNHIHISNSHAKCNSRWSQRFNTMQNQQVGHATTSNSFVPRSLVPSTSQVVPNQINKYNQRMNSPNLQWQSSTSWQTHNSRVAEIAPVLSSTSSTVSAKQVPTQGNKRKLPRSSSTRTTQQPSEAIRRILNMNPTRTVTYNVLPARQNQNGNMQMGMGTCNYDLRNQLLSLREQRRYEPSRCGRPQKRAIEESSSQHRKLQQVSSKSGKAATNPTSQQEQRTPDSVVNRDQNVIPANPPAATRHVVNTVYDMEFERKGLPIDPHLRLFKRPPPPPPENESA